MKKLFWVIIIVIVVIIGFLLWGNDASRVSAPTGSEVVPGNDTTGAINQDLENLELGDLNQEFETIDADLNQL
ncbi:MAG TPA: hypothetical protein VNK70_00555 [Candidatus Paceibacterota bacterium]|nr:hypothetical protein [Candidatus Paceibacterota bacterium]